MGGAGRESFALWINWRACLRVRTWRFSRRLLFEDNIMPVVCLLLGHHPYNTSGVGEQPETACRRCHRWLRHLDPPISPPSIPYFSNDFRLPPGPFNG